MSKMFNYEADQIHDMVHPKLLTDSSHYVAECKDIILTEAKPNYPKLTDYESEWLYFYEYIYEGGGDPVNLEYKTLEFIGKAVVQNAIPFIYKRAIFKGNTFVNVLNFDNVPSNYLFTQDIAIKQNVVYTVKGTLKSDNRYSTSDTPVLRIKETNSNGKDLIFINGLEGAKTKIINQTFINTTSNVIHVRIFNQKPENSDFMIIEGDYTNADIPYFEGMQTVKKPVLITTGKNLFDKTKITANKIVIGGGVEMASNGSACTDYIPVIKGKTYIRNGGGATIGVYDTDKKFVERTGGLSKFTATANGYIRWNINSYASVIDTLQIEEGTTTTTYEPYIGTNILTVNEDVTLHGVGDVKDELNLLTGELTQRVGEVVYDGSDDEKWKSETMSMIPDNIVFSIPLKNHFTNTDSEYMRSIIKDNMGFTNNCLHATVNASALNKKRGFSIHGNGNVYFTIPKSECSSLAEWKSMLQQSPLILQYGLKEVNVKSVDLNKSSFKPYEGTNHYYASSDTIPPSCELSVPIESTGEQTLMAISQED